MQWKNHLAIAFSLIKSLWGTRDKTLLPAEVCTLWRAVKQAHQLSGLWRWDQDWGWSTAWWAVKSHLSWSLSPSKHTGYASYLWLLILGRWLLLKALYFTRYSQLWFLSCGSSSFQNNSQVCQLSTSQPRWSFQLPSFQIMKLYPSKVLVPVIPTAESCTWPYRWLWSGLVFSWRNLIQKGSICLENFQYEVEKRRAWAHCATRYIFGQFIHILLEWNFCILIDRWASKILIRHWQILYY